MKFLLVAVAILFSITTAPAFAGTYEGADKAYDAGDYEKAKSIALPLAKAGNAKAMNLIGLMHARGRGLNESPKDACDWYEKAALHNDEYGLSNLAGCYWTGNGREQNLELAAKWCEPAAEAGNRDCQLDLLIYYVEIDHKEAQKWGQLAVNQRSSIAKVVMKSANIKHSGPKATVVDDICVWAMIFGLGMPRDYCDDLFLSANPK